MNPFEFFEDMQAKQHINLSAYAWDIIEQDIVEFQNSNPQKISGFMNRILEIYLRDGLFPADITTSILDYESQQRKWLNTISGLTVEQSHEIISSLRNQYVYSLLKNFHSEKGIGKKFDVNNACRFLLKEKGKHGYEVEVFKKRGTYINTILEHYARLPMTEREDIFFTDRLRELEYCIHKKQVIYITSAFRSNPIIPYKLLHDKYGIHTYLVALAYDSPTYQSYLFRISQIKDISRTNIYAEKISKETIQLLENEIKQKGIQYLPGNAQDITVRLTPAGKNLYHRITYQRPTYQAQTPEEVAQNIFRFTCTPYQAFVYFKGFGRDAEILAPQSLREDCIQFYKNAFDTYKGEID